MEHKVDIIKHWKKMGKHFGYPQCCIDSFCGQVTLRSQRKAGNKSGFIPCKNHSKEILEQKIELKSLMLRKYNG